MPATDDETLSTGEVAKLLQVDPVTVWRIPRRELPYSQTPGGARGRGHRRYRRGDVEAYRGQRAAPVPPPSIEDRVVELEAWRDRHQHGHEGN